MNNRTRKVSFARAAGVSAAAALVMGGLSAGVANATAINIGGNVNADFLGVHCIAASCVDLATGGYTVAGGGLVNPAVSVASQYLTPGSDSSNPANTLSYNVTSSGNNPPGATTDITVTGLSGAFEIYWGSVDSYNIVEFFDGATSVLTLNGTQLRDAIFAVDPGVIPAQSGNINYNFDAYIRFGTGTDTFDSVVLSSSNGVAFELATRTVPEPGMLSLVGLAALLAGVGLARRRAEAVSG